MSTINSVELYSQSSDRFQVSIIQYDSYMRFLISVGGLVAIRKIIHIGMELKAPMRLVVLVALTTHVLGKNTNG